MTGVPPQLQDKLGAAYSFQRELGGGGMARVFLVEDTRLHRRIVVKILSTELASSVSAERFEREIRTAAMLQQANIVPLLDAGQADGIAYFTMPYVEGESLRSRLQETVSLPVTDTVSILRDVTRALAFAHEHGVVHRDIKPDNILLSGATAVVTDFGIAKAVVAARRDASDNTVTAFGTAIGTPAYMAPEQAAADPHVDDRADMYALGCTAYEMLTGAPPFAGPSVQQIMHAHVELEPRDIRQLRPKIPEALAALVMQCLEKNPADRPSAPDVLRRLEPIAGATADGRTVPVAATAPTLTKKAFALYAAAFIVVAILARLAISMTGLPDWVFAGALIVMALGLPVLILTALGSSRHLTWRRAALGGVMALSSFIVIVAGYMVLRSLGIGPAGSLLAAGRVQPKQPVVVADFRSLGPDSTLGSVVAEAIRADLNQSNVVRVTPPSQITAALRRMQRPPGKPFDYAVAQELATREGIGVIVDGEVRPLGGGFLVSIRLTESDSGQPLASFHETADSPSQLIPTLGRLSRKLRGKIGESLKNVRTSLPLEQVTTASLAALEKHTVALRALEMQDFQRFIRNEEEAIALDTGFAMAYRRLGIQLMNRSGQAQRAESLLKKAVEHTDRLPPVERFLTLGSSYMAPGRPQWDKAYEAYDRVLELDPDNYIAINNSALILSRRREDGRAAEMYSRATRSSPNMITPYFNLLFVRYRLGGYRAMEETLNAMRERFPNAPLTQGMNALALLAQGQRDSAAALLRRREPMNPDAEPPTFQLASIANTQGAIAEGTEWLGKWHRARKKRGVGGSDVQFAFDRAWAEGWHLGRRARAVSIADSAVASAAFKALPPDEKQYDFVAIVYAMAGRPDRARALLAEAERLNAWSPTRRALSGMIERDAARHATLGWIALAERRYEDAVREFRANDEADCLSCPSPLIALAYDRAEQVDSAIAFYHRFLDAPDFYREVDGDFLAPTYKRLGELYETRGDKQQAAGYYLKFVDLWKNADAPLQPTVAEVRRRIARLKDTERS